MTYIRHYNMMAKTGGAEQLCRALSTLQATVSTFPGSLGVDLLQSVDQPENFLLIERWDSKENHAAAGKRLPPDVMQAMKDAMGAAPVALSLKPVTG